MKTAKDVLAMIKDNDVKYADFRFTDPRGKWQHVTFDISIIEEETFSEGQMFDGSSIAGWKRSEEHTSELQSRLHLVCRLLLEKKKHEPLNPLITFCHHHTTQRNPSA